MKKRKEVVKLIPEIKIKKYTINYTKLEKS